VVPEPPAISSRRSAPQTPRLELLTDQQPEARFPEFPPPAFQRPARLPAEPIARRALHTRS